MDQSVDITPDTETSDAPAPMLLLRQKKKVLARIPLEKSVTVMGRSSKCDIVLDDSSGVSRQHAHVLYIDGELVVEDLGSRNGTFVNGKIAKRRTLRPGDRIAIGEYRLHYLQSPRSPAIEKPSREKLSDLLRRWRGAAIVTNSTGCPLCGIDDHDAEAPVAAGSADWSMTVERGLPGGYPGLSSGVGVRDVSPADVQAEVTCNDDAAADDPADATGDRDEEVRDKADESDSALSEVLSQEIDQEMLETTEWTPEEQATSATADDDDNVEDDAPMADEIVEARGDDAPTDEELAQIDVDPAVALGVDPQADAADAAESRPVTMADLVDDEDDDEDDNWAARLRSRTLRARKKPQRRKPLSRRLRLNR